MLKNIIRSSLFAVVSLSVITSQANAFCSCWSSGEARAQGSTCGAGLDFDTIGIQYSTCQYWCRVNADRNHQWAYIDQPAIKACKESFASVVRVPSEKDCDLIVYLGNGFDADVLWRAFFSSHIYCAPPEKTGPVNKS